MAPAIDNGAPASTLLYAATLAWHPVHGAADVATRNARIIACVAARNQGARTVAINKREQKGAHQT